MMLDWLKDKKVVVLGLGINNQGLVDFLKKKNIDFEVIENWNSWNELGDLSRHEVIFRTPGLPYNSPPIQNALSNGSRIYSQTKLFFDLCPSAIIGVTGTKGKGTVAALIEKILINAGKKVFFGGNIGKDPFEFLDQLRGDEFVILELSSFQLQDMTTSPHIAVVLEIKMEEHLDDTGQVQYATHYSEEEYANAKSKIIEFQTQNDFAVLHSNLPEWFIKLGKGKKVFIKAEQVVGYKTKLLGEHNKINVAAAVAVGQLLSVAPEVINKVVAEFEGLPHRLQDLGVISGIRYVNDSGGTTPSKTIAAINAVSGPIILILGGSLKKVDYTPLADFLRQTKKVKGLVLVGQSTSLILGVLSDYTGEILTGAKNMTEMVKQAQSLAAPGDTILLSPSTASHDMFKNFMDRGEQFINTVKQ